MRMAARRSSGLLELSEMRLPLIALIGRSSASAAIWVSTVARPWPFADDPVYTATRPSSSRTRRAPSRGPEAPPST